jgi:hypothetical protein
MMETPARNKTQKPEKHKNMELKKYNIVFNSPLGGTLQTFENHWFM